MVRPEGRRALVRGSEDGAMDCVGVTVREGMRGGIDVIGGCHLRCVDGSATL